MARVVVLLLVLGLAFPGHAAPASQQSGTFLIVAGTSIGPISLGMSFEEVLKLFGHYGSQNVAIPGFPRYIWTELPDNRLVGRFVVSTAGSPASVDAMSVASDGRYMTSTGIHIGDPSASVRSIMGAPAAVQTGFYDADIWLYQGIAFTIGNSNSKQCEGRVCGIGVGRGFAEVF